MNAAIHLVRLRARLVADEHHWRAPIIVLLQLWVCYLGVPNTAKGLEDAYIGLTPVPRLTRRLAVAAPHEGAVDDEEGHEHGLPQYVLDTYFALSMQCAILSTILFLRSTTPFYYDEYGVIR